ncbi:MAG: hydrogenase maturation protease [Thermoleophilaceae bacterium]|nr:hydrogenase maturation protease [Thermoleophilaceae bacterium]
MLGIGNPWRGDDAAGLEVARRLREAGLRALEREGEPSTLLDAWEGEREVILVDAVSSGCEPGTVHRLDAAAAPLPAELFAVSTHHLSVADAVELARSLGRLPERLELYGIEGAAFDAGGGMTPAVAEAVEAVAAELRARLSA